MEHLNPFSLSLNQLFSIPYNPAREISNSLKKTGYKVKNDIHIIGNHHILFSTIRLVEALIELGFKAKNIHLIGKYYSTSESVSAHLKSLGVDVFLTPEPNLGRYDESQKVAIEHFWKNLEGRFKSFPPSKIILFDDGHQCVDAIPKYFTDNFPIIGCEVTTNGTYSEKYASEISMVELATAKAKTDFDGPTITNSFLNRLDFISEKIISDNMTIGVVGLGNIGLSTARYFSSLGYEVVVYDLVKTTGSHEFRFLNSLKELVCLSDYIFGATGKDIFENSIELLEFHEGQHFFSLSSRDIEFKSLLLKISTPGNSYTVNAKGDVVASIKGALITISNKGFPSNFMRTPTNMSVYLDQRFACIYLISIVQCSILLNTPLGHPKLHGTHRIKLSPKLQKIAIDRCKQGLIDSGIYPSNVFYNNPEDYAGTNTEESLASDLISEPNILSLLENSLDSFSKDFCRLTEQRSCSYDDVSFQSNLSFAI